MHSAGGPPSSHSLPTGPKPTATVFAYLSRFRGKPIRQRLPPVATALLHKCSILRCLTWLHDANHDGRGAVREGGAIATLACGRRANPAERVKVVHREVDLLPTELPLAVSPRSNGLGDRVTVLNAIFRRYPMHRRE